MMVTSIQTKLNKQVILVQKKWSEKFRRPGIFNALAFFEKCTTHNGMKFYTRDF